MGEAKRRARMVSVAIDIGPEEMTKLFVLASKHSELRAGPDEPPDGPLLRICAMSMAFAGFVSCQLQETPPQAYRDMVDAALKQGVQLGQQFRAFHENEPEDEGAGHA